MVDNAGGESAVDNAAELDAGTADDIIDTSEGSVDSLEVPAKDAPEALIEDNGKLRRLRSLPPAMVAVVVGTVCVVALGVVVGWTGMRFLDARHTGGQNALYVRVARQAATNLTTIDWQHPEADIQRIVDSASGPFHDDFIQRAPGFIDLVKQTKSKTTGTVTEAGVESVADTDAQVLVTVSVVTTTEGKPDQHPRSWRMRFSVEKSSDDPKVTNVSFVP